jgi:hypothetical protein
MAGPIEDSGTWQQFFKGNSTLHNRKLCNTATVLS